MKKPDKKRSAAILAGIVILSILITGACIMIFRSHNGGKAGENRITDLKLLTLRLSGMRFSEEYELETNGDQTAVTYYTISYAGGREERVLVQSAVRDTQAVIDELNKCRVLQWDGFHGKHPIGVRDGTMFQLSATVNGGQTLTAEGSENFPRHFHEFIAWLSETVR